MAQKILSNKKSAPSGSASSKISSCTLNLVDSPLIIDDLHLICTFNQSFLFPHFKFLKLADKHGSNTASFQARYLTVIYLLMMNYLRNIKEDWKRNAHSRDYLQSLSELNTTDKVEEEKKFTHFFATSPILSPSTSSSGQIIFSSLAYSQINGRRRLLQVC